MFPFFRRSRQDTPAAVIAGKTVQEAHEITLRDPSIGAAMQADAPYKLDRTDQNPIYHRYQGTPEQWKAVEDDYKWVEDFWATAPGPEPSSFDGAIGDLANAAKALYDQSKGVQASGAPWLSASHALGTWSSTAATKFRNNVWFRMPTIIRRQAGVATIMAHGLAAERDTWVEHRKALKDTAEKTITALNAVKISAPDNSAAELNIAAGIFTMLAGVLAIPFTGGASTGVVVLGASAAGANFVAGALTVGSGVAGMKRGERTTVPLGAATVDEVLYNMTKAVSDADGQVDDNEEKICAGLQAAYDYLTSTATTESETSDIPEDQLPEGVKPGQFDEKMYSPREKMVLPRPSLVGDAGKLPQPRVKT